MSSEPLAFGPVQATVRYLKIKQTPQGARWCEELDAYVSADLHYRVRGIRKEGLWKKTLVERVLNKPAKAEENSFVLAMGLTHAKMHLIPLEVAQQDNKVRYRGLDDTVLMDNEAAAIEKRFGGNLISLWEAQTRPDVRYRGKNPLRPEQLTAAIEDESKEVVRAELPRNFFAPLQHGSKTLLPPIPVVDGRVAR